MEFQPQNIFNELQPRKFGEEFDFIELHVNNPIGELQQIEVPYLYYDLDPTLTNDQGLSSGVIVNPEEDLRRLGYSIGNYILNYKFYKQQLVKDGNFDSFPFILKTISPSRQEIRITTFDISDIELKTNFDQFISDREGAEYFTEFYINFGSGLIFPAVNIAIEEDQDPYTILIRLYDPLPTSVQVGDNLRVVEEISETFSIDINLAPPIFEPIDNTISLRGANFNINLNLDNNVSSQYYTYDNILKTNSTSSYRHLLNKLSSSVLPNIDYTDYSNFVHFSSAEERLKNFKYKLSLLETYQQDIDLLTNVSGSTSSSYFIVTNKQSLESKIDNLVSNFDGYEYFLYYESSSQAWPKSTSTKPYTLYSVSSPQVTTWYENQLESASIYDNTNVNILVNTIPNYIRDNEDNAPYELFVNMVAQHFDYIWTFTKSITDIYDTQNDVNRGISKNLVRTALESLGFEVFQDQENENIFEYLIGETIDGQFNYQAPSGQTMVTASNAASLPKQDIQKEIWKRIYHNLPYLLKTKGTERGVKALLNCYGLPSTIINVKEFGGPQATSNDYNLYIHDKFSFAYTMFGSSSLTNTFWQTAPEKTVNFRFNTRTKQDQQIWLKEPASGSWSFTASLEHSSSAAPGTTYYDYGRIRLDIISSSVSSSFYTSEYLPIFDNDWWNFGISVEDNGNFQISCQKAIDYQENKYITNIIFDSTGSGDFDSIGGAIYHSFVSASTVHIGGPGSGSGFIGYLQEYREYNEALNDIALDTITLSHEHFGGNTYSSSYDTLYYRLPLGFDLRSDISSSISGTSSYAVTGYVTMGYYVTQSLIGSQQLISYHPSYNNTELRTAEITGSFAWVNNEETLYTRYIEVGSGLTSNKVRIEAVTTNGTILSPEISITQAAYDTQPIDSHKLGIYFSPVHEQNIEILGQFGAIKYDNFIGDPADIDKDYYTGLKDLTQEYTQRNNRRYNFWDYIKLIQYFDNTLFGSLEQMVPARTRLMTGLVIEPSLLERAKIGTDYPSLKDQKYDVPALDLQPGTEASYLNYNAYLDVEGTYLQFNNENPLRNNVMGNRLSSVYFTRVVGADPQAQLPTASWQDTYPPLSILDPGEYPPLPSFEP